MLLSKFSKYILPVCFLSVTAISCNKMLDVDPQDTLVEKNMYMNLADADAAVLGVYGQFMKIAENHILLNELRADLMSPTENADEYLKQLNEHREDTKNPYLNPRPYYTVILNCNDVLANLDVMFAAKKLKVEEYNMRYSDIAALRTWVYLQLGVQYGKVPYVTDRLATTADLGNAGLFPRIEFSVLLDLLVRTMESLPYMVPYPPTSGLVTTVDAFNTSKFFVNKQALLGELYLWKGNYRQAASMFKNVMETAGTGQFNVLRVSGSSKADNKDISVGYVRYRETDENSLIDNNSQGWRSIFANNSDELFNYECVWFLPFDKTFKPANPFINLFSNRGGRYLLKPSQLAVDNWNAQMQKNDFPYDARGKKFSWRMLDGQPVIMKYLYSFLDGTSFLPVNQFEKGGRWYLYRAASLHLNYAEAANRDNRHYIAYALVNDGIPTIPTKITTEGYPYNFDARKSDNPRIAADWYQNVGVRGRANLYPQQLLGDSTVAMEDQIINEAGLELAYEGRRWSDLVRISLRRNDASYLAERVYQKLLRDNNPQASAVKAKLMNKENWYLPFRWE